MSTAPAPDGSGVPPDHGSTTTDATGAEPVTAASPIEPAPALAPETAAPTDVIAPPPPAVPPVVDVRDLDWGAVRQAADPPTVRARIRPAVERMESLLDRAGGPGLLFDADRASGLDRAIVVSAEAADGPLWIVGDLHGDLLALEAALARIRQVAAAEGGREPRIVFLGDFFDDAGHGLEVLLRVFELVADSPERVCVIAGNHDEALSFDGVRFATTVSPGDFAEFLNAHRAHEWIERAGKLAVRLVALAPRALFFPDGLLIAHGGFPLIDLHAQLEATGDWNDPACLNDFVWARAHPKARRKMPNRHARGSSFGHEDFADFCALSTRLGRPVTHMARGHDHPDERYAVHPAYAAHPMLTTVALSRRLGREAFGPSARVPTLARVVAGCLPEVHRLHIPAEIVDGLYPQAEEVATSAPPPVALSAGVQALAAAGVRPAAAAPAPAATGHEDAAAAAASATRAASAAAAAGAGPARPIP